MSWPNPLVPEPITNCLSIWATGLEVSESLKEKPGWKALGQKARRLHVAWAPHLLPRGSSGVMVSPQTQGCRLHAVSPGQALSDWVCSL